MPLTSLITVAAESSEEAPIHPYVVGAIAFAILLAMLFALTSFGKGRDHS
jgi:hypothetical protein